MRADSKVEETDVTSCTCVCVCVSVCDGLCVFVCVGVYWCVLERVCWCAWFCVGVCDSVGVSWSVCFGVFVLLCAVV